MSCRIGLKSLFAVVGLSVLLGGKACAQEVVARATVDTTAALLGQPVRLVLQLSQPANLTINWPLFIDSLGGMEIWKYDPVDTVRVDDASVLLRSQTFYLTSYDSGSFTIPSLGFPYVPGAGRQEVTAATDPLTITFVPVPVDTTLEIRDIRNVEAAPFDYRIILYLLLAWHAILLVVGLLVWALRRKSGEVQEPAVEVEPVVAHLAALEALRLLEEERVWQEGKVKEYYTRLTDILREYMERRWQFSTLELTSDEILSHAAIRNLPVSQQEQLERVLRLSDLVKFARWQAISSENEWALQQAVKFVHDTADAGASDISQQSVKEGAV